MDSHGTSSAPTDSHGTSPAHTDSHVTSPALTDSHVTSPAPTDSHAALQGASCTTGGIFRGQATGNTLNIGDMIDPESGVEAKAGDLLIGRVLVYNSCDDNAKPLMSIDHLVTLILKPTLVELGSKYSPVKSMSIPCLVA
jgi:hypothetical protein